MFKPVTPNTENNLLSTIFTISKILVDVYNIFNESKPSNRIDVSDYLLPNATVVDYSCVDRGTHIRH